MLDHPTRVAVVRLHAEGHGARTIAKVLGISRNAVREVIRSGQTEVPSPERVEKAAPHLERIRTLYTECKGNLVRVQEELAKQNVHLGYSTLTAFCRRHEIGRRRRTPVGQYHFVAGEEMQHDTSPHRVKVAGRKRPLQCASLVLCYSRMVFVQAYPRFSRIECRQFLTKALTYFGGAAVRCMVDNTSVVRAHGTGKNMVPAPEMKALAERFDFTFEAHNVGDAERSGRVERRFHYVENNFYPGRTFASLADLNAQAVTWCDQVNHTYRNKLRASAIELFAAEQPVLQPLPIYVPEVYEMHLRRVDVEGYVCLHTNRYSVPVELIGRTIRIRETEERLHFYDGHRLVTEHTPADPGAHARITVAEHRPDRHWRRDRPPSPQERTLRTVSPTLERMVDRLKKRHGGNAVRAVRRLHKLYLDYPTEAVIEAVTRALDFDLADLGRIERMVLKATGETFFRLPHANHEENDDG